MTNEPRLDPVDERIVAILQQDGRRTYAEIAALVGLTPPSAHDRVKKLEARGVIRGYEAQVDPVAAGFQVLAFVLVVQDSHADWDAIGAHFRSIAEIVECHHVAGEEDFLLKVRARDTLDLERVLRAVASGGQVRSTRTMVALSSSFEGRGVPLSAGPVQTPARGQNGRIRAAEGRGLALLTAHSVHLATSAPALDPETERADGWDAVAGPGFAEGGHPAVAADVSPIPPLAPFDPLPADD
jgi:Lrp/AsnC family transcriptional regulator, leucine-responsive regulatory protein